MYKSVKRMSLLKCLHNEVSNFSPRTSNWIRIFRWSSGLKEKKAENLENLADDLSFSSFLQQRQEEARRSFLVRVYNLDVWPSLFNMCSSVGKIKKAFHYESVSYEKNQFHFILIEMSTEAQLNQFLKQTLKINPGSDHYNQFLVLNENNVLFKNNSKKKSNYNSYFNSHNGDDSDKKMKHNEKLIDTSPSFNKKLLNKELINTNNNLSDLIRNCYNILKMNDIETRKRFLMCRQVEVLCSGFLPNAVAYPFGSSINGFGSFDCDLDISLVPMVKNKDGVFLQQNYLDFSSDLMKSHLSVITELLKHFMNGCSNVFFIKHAKVPIVKYKNIFTNVDCDLSLYNLHGIAMSQVLYNAASIDWRIRALVLFLKLWAHRVELVVKSPSPNLSNFSLCLMVLFFFQQIKMIPPFHVFSCSEYEILELDNELSGSFTKNQSKTKNNKSLGALLKLFFEFYESFNFQKWGISLSKGEVINNTLGCPLYIENPLSPNLNVSVNVRGNEMKYTKELLTDVVNILSNGSSSTQIEQLFGLTYKKKYNFRKCSK